jgi:hypothetical protein
MTNIITGNINGNKINGTSELERNVIMPSSSKCAHKSQKLAEGGTGIQTCLFIPLENQRKKEDGKSNPSIGLPFTKQWRSTELPKGAEIKEIGIQYLNPLANPSESTYCLQKRH